VALAHDGATPSLVLDAGTGIRRVTALLGGSAFAGTILLTHLHWDHFQGLPFFAGGDRTDSRVDLLLPDQEDGRDAEEVLARGMSPPQFPIRPRELRGSWSFDTLSPGRVEVEGFVVEVREVPHKGGRTFGYRVADGTSSIAYIPDHCPTALGPGPDGWGEYHPAVLELADGVDLLVHDAHLLPEELAAEASFGHAACDYAAALGRWAGAKQVALFHHKPDRTDDALDDQARRFEGQTQHVTVATESTVLDL
jgi:ribonuclease BN (tRNA processing enzyme)